MSTSPSRWRRLGLPALLACSFLSLFALGFFLARPKPPSPFVGTWTDPSGRARLKLLADGTGSASLPPLIHEEPVSWQEREGGRMATLQIGGGARRADDSVAPGFGVAATAGITADRRTLALTTPLIRLDLEREVAVSP